MKSIAIEKAIEIALEQHQAGQFERAEGLYMEILRQDPGNVDAMHLLGLLALQGKNAHAAVQLIRAAVSRRGDVPVFHYSLAEALRSLKLNSEAIASYRTAISLAPEYFEPQNNLSIVLNEVGDYEGAVTAARMAAQLRPEDATPWNNLGNALRGLSRWAESIAAYQKAISLRPRFAECLNNLGMVLCRVNRVEEGLAAFQNAIQIMPTASMIHNNAGTALSQLSRHAEAVSSFEKAFELDPENFEAANNLGAALRAMSQHQHAIPYFEKAIALNPESSAGYANLAASLKDMGKKDEALVAVDKAIALNPKSVREKFLRAILLRDMSRIDEAVAVFRETLEQAPDDVRTLTALGYALQERGQLDEAMQCLKRSVELNPDPQTHSNVLMTINYHPGYSPAELLVAHRGWARLHEEPLRSNWPIHTNVRDPDRKLRIGYISPDFRGHVVAHFLEPVLDNHDHSNFEIYGYANVTAVDTRTYRMRSQIDHWREIAQMTPDQVAQMIREDQIDILVELAGHTGGNALPVIARKPAPIQINMIGFPSTTGLSAMDYRITDGRCDPPGISDEFNSEKLIRLPELFWCYQPSDEAPEVGPLPADSNDMFTFTSVNNLTKVTPQVQELWARMLLAVPNSRLVMQTSALASEQTRQAVTATFAKAGVSSDRLDLRVWSDNYNYLCLLNQSDLTLDPFPFNGGTTTCHGLYMGAPVITLAGDRHASRMGLSMMSAIGLPEFIAQTPEQYIQIAVDFANDLPRLREIRKGMRDRLKASPLLDAAGYTRHLESAFRQVWRSECDSSAMGTT